MEGREIINVDALLSGDLKVYPHGLQYPANTDLKYSPEHRRVGGYQTATVQDNLLLQHRLDDIVWLNASVHHVLDLRRSHGLVEHRLLLANDANSQFLAVYQDSSDERADGVHYVVEKRGAISYGPPVTQRSCSMVELRKSRIHIQAIHLEVGTFAVQQDTPELAETINRIRIAKSVDYVRSWFLVKVLLEFENKCYRYSTI